MNETWWIVKDGTYSYIYKINSQEPRTLGNNWSDEGPFKTFSEAKKELLSYAQDLAHEWREYSKHVRSMRKADADEK